MWPGCEVEWLDALRIMGRWVPSTFNWIYATNVESTPWLYDFFYDSLWRYRWFANACRRFVGAWCGPLMRREVLGAHPDLIVSTYPLGTAGLDWMRRHGDLAGVPVTAIVSDFAPHPFWVYPDADLHYVMSEASLRAMYRAEPDAVGAVGAPPVRREFRPRDRSAARAEFGLPTTGFTALISCGALGFGAMERAADAALRADGVSRVLVVCGRNDRTRRALAERGDPRLVPIGWTDDMPGLLACSDVVVTNAGGATALEALACGRAVTMFEPIAGHGRANAELMAESELAELCPHATDLTGTLRRWTDDSAELAEREERALKHACTADLDDQVAALADVPQHHGPRSLRPQDAFFVHATTPEVPQQTGAILHLEESARTLEEWRGLLAERIRSRATELPMLSRRLVTRPGRRPQWIHDEVHAPDHVSCRELHSAEVDDEVLAEFFADPVRTDRPPWQLLVLHDSITGRAILAAKMHHSLGDGVAVTSNLVHLLCDEQQPKPASGKVNRPWYRRVPEVLRGLTGLALSGAAPSRCWTGTSSPERSFGHLSLPAAQARAIARDHGVTSTGLMLGLVAEALHRTHRERNPAARFRVMVPRTARTGRGGAGMSEPGNHTLSMSLDLPIGPMPTPWRVRAAARALLQLETSGQPIATGAVMTAMGLLPAGLHRWVVRRVYHRRFFNAIVSVLPGQRRPAHIDGVRITEVLPVLSLADGVGLAVGAIGWGEHFGFGVTTDPALAPRAEVFTEHLRDAFAEMRARR
ncbi:hypothetical protein GCM10009854_34830 [Saccharopolyspora halophila]|uniref:Diacylglycerol O-acyltransferase n=1 Tax=Saccharopolyspora halophila TaxID=405551 RepID=A0ABN3GK63_9PSEU